MNCISASGPPRSRPRVGGSCAISVLVARWPWGSRGTHRRPGVGGGGAVVEHQQGRIARQRPHHRGVRGRARAGRASRRTSLPSPRSCSTPNRMNWRARSVVIITNTPSRWPRSPGAPRTTVGFPNPKIIAAVSPPLTGAGSADAAFQVLYDIEQGAAATYLQALGNLTSSSASGPAGSILPIEVATRHRDRLDARATDRSVDAGLPDHLGGVRSRPVLRLNAARGA